MPTISRHPSHAVSRLAAIAAAALMLAACGKDEVATPPATSAIATPVAPAGQVGQSGPQAQERAGSPSGGLPVRGTIETRLDGQVQRWDITTLADTTRMSAGMVTDLGMGLSVTLWGEASGQTPGASGTFKLDFGVPNLRSLDVKPQESQATWIVRRGISPPFWTSTNGIELVLTQAHFDGEKGRIEGRFKALLCLREKASLPPDTSNCKPVEGSFATDLEKEKF